MPTDVVCDAEASILSRHDSCKLLLKFILYFSNMKWYLRDRFALRCSSQGHSYLPGINWIETIDRVL